MYCRPAPTTEGEADRGGGAWGVAGVANIALEPVFPVGEGRGDPGGGDAGADRTGRFWIESSVASREENSNSSGSTDREKVEAAGGTMAGGG